MSEELENVESILYEALRLPEARARAAYLEATCGIDTPLRADVESLLRAYEGRAGVLKAPDGLLDEPADAVTEGPGTVIGRYKLLEKIGEGGMALVYMAEQEQPIRRKVALKIIKLGMDTRQVIARFEAERQALALMDHPSIAKVLDAGATETGRPYFVMELVTGVSITEYCDRNSLSTKDRLALFLQVCHAVQHAHQKGIIHRDIKPSNVMVTHHDGKPVPKVIDFGIAKATNQKLTEKTLFTRYAHIIGTPAYMSPEQAELSDLDIDTRSDIYSLGVLLYELLTGTTPFSEEELRKAGYIEMQRVIREQEPAKPSTKLGTLGETLADVAKHRNSTPDLLTKAVRGDLDWIVMKSLEKDRVRRYETAGSLAEDVRRHLESEPVLARGPSATYRLRKFLRRHQVQVLVGLAVGVLLAVVAIVLSLWNQDRRQLAEAEGFRHQGILSQAREQYARADREAALETIRPILKSRHVGAEAQLLQASILVDNRQSEEAVTTLTNLLGEPPTIAGAAHALLARILWESESLNAEKLKEIEEHRRQAEALLPETAEAYFLHAMTTLTIKEQLAALDKALQLAPDHYESRRLRAFMYYASRKYEKMKDDALGMTFLRRGDLVGYSLRAIALRELGKYAEAVAEYDNALARTAKQDPQYLDLARQRSETLLRKGDYEQVMAQAQDYLKLSPDNAVLPYHVFGALTALGDYEKASTVFAEIVGRTPTSRNEFQYWSMKYVFDTLAAGRSWHLPGREPVGPAFLAMVEAEETYIELAAKGRRVITDGFNAHWSPDGTKLVFSLGVQGRSGVAVFDLETKETELLIVPGQDPRWSPDGKYIAFVRDRQALRLEEFTVTERRKQDRPIVNEELWIINAEGTEPRRLARGGWPTWSQDSTTLYYPSRAENALCSISIAGRDAKPQQIMACPSPYPSVSPNQQRVAFLENASLKVKDLASQALVAEWGVPFTAAAGPVWSPTGRELCLTGRNNSEDRTGLWLYGFDSTEPARSLGGQITGASWTADGAKLVFCLGAPYYQLWVADLDANASARAALGPTQTSEEYLQEMVRLYTRRIEVAPQDAYAHSSRAQYYDYLHEQEKAQADMRQFSAILSGETSLAFPIPAPRRLRGAINGPFGYQLAFSVGRRDNGIPVLCVAFGQKGRCEMKVFEVPMLAMSLVGLGLLSGFDAPPARADFVRGTAVNVRSVIPVLDPAFETPESMSSDGLELYIASGRPDYSNWDIWVLKRASKEDKWGPPENLGPLVNSAGIDVGAHISPDGLTLYFSSDRPGGYGGWDEYMTTRPTKKAPWGQAVNLGPKINSAAGEGGAVESPDGLELYIALDRPGGYGGGDAYVVRRATRNDPWGDPVNLGPVVNTAYGDAAFPLNERVLLILSDRPGGYGDGDWWISRRTSVSDPWQTPVNLGPTFNTSGREGVDAFITLDPPTLWYADNTTWEAYQAPILPVVDFSGDKRVDLVDLVMLIDDWGKSKSVRDIGPMPWGDGKVDIEDLKVFMTYYEKENLPAQP
jgi:serine/threonine protein kinase/Tol biopolymer transport system component/predicted negative regulator of RcsB-dependent stress response